MYSVPYLRKNPCQEEILTGWHHGFPLNNNPTILLRFLYIFIPSHWDISSCSKLDSSQQESPIIVSLT